MLYFRGPFAVMSEPKCWMPQAQVLYFGAQASSQLQERVPVVGLADSVKSVLFSAEHFSHLFVNILFRPFMLIIWLGSEPL